MCIDNPEAVAQAAYRDASWFNNPDTRTPKRGHILRADGRPACGLVAVMCDPEPADCIPEILRCKRPGCRQRWPIEMAEEQAEPLPRTTDPDQFRALCEALQACEAADNQERAAVLRKMVDAAAFCQCPSCDDRPDRRAECATCAGDGFVPEIN